MKITKYILLILVILSGCTLNFLDSDDDPSEGGNYSVYDSQTDTKYTYDSDDNLLWSDVYDFNASGQCILMKHLLPSGTVLWSYVYSWNNDNVEIEAYYNNENELSWYNQFIYNSSNQVIEQANYDGTGTLQWFKSFTYTTAGNELQTARFSSSSALEWAYDYTYDGSDRLTVSSAYDDSSDRIAYISYEYEGGSPFRILKKTGYGTTHRTDTFKTECAGFSFPTYGGVNTTDRNTSSLSVPTAPTAPIIPVITLTDTVFGSHQWMSLWVYDSFGYSTVSLNSDNLPVYMKREAPDYLDDLPIEVELTYSETKVISKTTTYNNQEVLKLEFTYNGNYLISMNTTGVSLIIPLRYDFTYDANHFPESISIYNESTMLQKFVYEYSVDTGTITDLKDFAKLGEPTIRHYDGDNSLIESFVFDYNDVDTISVTVTNAQNIPNGSFHLVYDANDNVTSLSSYDSADNQLWKYSYSYDDLHNRIAETKLDENDIPEVAISFDVESLFEDLKRFLP